MAKKTIHRGPTPKSRSRSVGPSPASCFTSSLPLLLLLLLLPPPLPSISPKRPGSVTKRTQGTRTPVRDSLTSSFGPSGGAPVVCGVYE